MRSTSHYIKPLIAGLFAVLINFVPSFITTATAQDISALLDDVIKAPHRTEENRARDKFRHPKETLMFFGLRADMTVLEISPAAGWYTEIIAPILKKNGQFYGASIKLSDDAPEAMKRRDASYKTMVASDPAVYGNAKIVNYDAAEPKFAPSGSADLALTFRNVHNWAKAGNVDAMFKGFYDSLKQGGVLGVVEHRAKPGTSYRKQIESGYMTEAYVIETARRAGFTLQASSEINSNPLDTADHPGGVWNLPPNLRAVTAADKPKYLAIGESDRMTLKFVKN